MMNDKNSHKMYVLDAILFIVFGMVIGWGLMIWKQNAVLSTLLEKHESKYTKFWAIDEILENEYYDEDVLSGSKKRAPKIFIKLNLEWLYRITREPKRLKRFYESNIKYMFEIKNSKDDLN